MFIKCLLSMVIILYNMQINIYLFISLCRFKYFPIFGKFLSFYQSLILKIYVDRAFGGDI